MDHTAEMFMKHALVLFECGRVFVVRCLADMTRRFQLYRNVKDAKVLERSTPAFQIALLVRRLCSGKRGRRHKPLSAAVVAPLEVGREGTSRLET
jgi:hypothetical protein